MSLTNNSFLEGPLQPGLMKICPHCGKWFVLELQDAMPDVEYGTLSQYKCKSCGRVTVFAARLPRDRMGLTAKSRPVHQSD